MVDQQKAGDQLETDGASGSAFDIGAGYLVAGWRVTGPIGSGSWGSVYAAERVSDGAPAAIKFLGTEGLSPGQRAAMDDLIRREVRFSQEPDHPNLVRTHEVVTVSDPDRPALDGAIALVMDRAERSLQDLISSARPAAPVPEWPGILRAVSSGLAHMHARGWVHGDLKPANVLLAADGGVWLADFGLTTELEGTHAYVPPLGSLDHVPPEWWSQRTDERGLAVRPTADVWAFGVLAHEVLTGGRHPFLGATARARALAAQSYARGAVPLRLDDALPESWRQLITECLAPDHASRARLTAQDLAERVRELCRAPASSRRRRTAMVAALATLLAAGASTGALLTVGGSASTDLHRATAAKPAATGTLQAIPGAIPAHSDVPVALRPYITSAALRCTNNEVSPILIAAMLKAESGFNPKAARPSTGEYGIAMWTPSVFNAWAIDGDGDGKKDYMSPPDAIATMGEFLCWLDQRFQHQGFHQNLQALIAAGYRTSDRTVLAAGGVPARTKPYVDEVMRYVAQYSH